MRHIRRCNFPQIMNHQLISLDMYCIPRRYIKTHKKEHKQMFIQFYREKNECKDKQSLKI